MDLLFAPVFLGGGGQSSRRPPPGSTSLTNIIVAINQSTNPGVVQTTARSTKERDVI